MQDSKYTSGDIVLYATIFQVLYPCRIYKRHHSDGQPRREFRLSPLKKTVPQCCSISLGAAIAGYFRASSPYDTRAIFHMKFRYRSIQGLKTSVLLKTAVTKKKSKLFF